VHKNSASAVFMTRVGGRNISYSLQEKDDAAWYKFEVRRYRLQQKTGAVLDDLEASKPMLLMDKK